MCLSMHVCLLIIVVCFLMKRFHGVFGIVCAVQIHSESTSLNALVCLHLISLMLLQI